MKGIELIDWLTDDQKKLLEHSALQYKRFARITIEVLGAESNTISVKVQQKENPTGKYLSAKELAERATDAFNGCMLYGWTLKVRTVPFKFLDVVDLEYINGKKKELGLTDTDISRLLDIRKENLSRLFSESRGLTKWHQAAFYYLFKSLDNQ